MTVPALVMCDAYTPAGDPIPTNKRCAAAKIFSHPDVVAEEPWYGIEQEYTLLQKDVKWPIGWPVGGFPGPQGPYYCGVGVDKAFGRDIVDSHYKACLYAGISISGINGEVMPGQWEFQVGPTVGISAGDELWVARYVLERITEIAGVVLSFDPKPIQINSYTLILMITGRLEWCRCSHQLQTLSGPVSDPSKLPKWNYDGSSTGQASGEDSEVILYPQAIFKDPFRRGNNILTKSMRCDGGYEVIKKAIEKLGARHTQHIAAYGEGNERRLTGRHETADINTFIWGVANRGASIRVGRDTEKAGKGYFEDRRPASNMDPYIVTSMIAETTILWKP
ncbi:hypothetical protein GOBAR_DD23688 [Gossypium barbadense]|nr:hypothetical protein GOBAR_DD23688 [Gossypium barbadense]